MLTEVLSVEDAVHTLHQGRHQAIPQSSVYFHKPRGPLLEHCLATAEVMRDTPSHRDIFRPALHCPLFSFPRRMHKDIPSGKVGRCWETTGEYHTLRMWPRCYSESLSSVTSAIFVLLISITLFLFLPDMNRIQCSKKTSAATKYIAGQPSQVRGCKPHEAPPKRAGETRLRWERRMGQTPNFP